MNQAVSNRVIDFFIAAIIISGFIIGPVILIISYIKNQKATFIKRLAPLLASIIVFFVTGIMFSIFFKKLTVRLFAFPAILFTVYMIIAFIINKTEKKD